MISNEMIPIHRLKALVRRHFRKDDALHQIEAIEIDRDTALKPAPTQIALFFAPRWWTTHQAWEAVMAEALTYQGIKPLFVTCQKAMTVCESYLIDQNPMGSLCSTCAFEGKGFIGKWGFEQTSLQGMLSAETKEQIQQAVAALTPEQFRQWKWNGISVWDHAGASLQRYFLSGQIVQTPESIPLIRKFLESTAIAIESIGHLLDRVRPNLVWMVNGMFFSEQVLRTLCTQRSIPYFCYERGRRKDSLFIAKNEPVILHSLDHHWVSKRQQELSATQRQWILDYLSLRETGKDFIDNFWPTQERSQEALIRALHLDPAKPIYSLFTNVLWDTAVYNRDIGFDGMLDFIFHAIEVFTKTPDRQLVIRIHPAEVRIAKQETRQKVLPAIQACFPSLPKNIQVIGPESPLSSYTLLELSKTVLVYSTTVGLEATARTGMPSIVAGSVHYREKGFTFDLFNRQDLQAALDRIDQESAQSRQARQELALRYAHLFYKDYHFILPEVHETGKGRFEFQFEKQTDLNPQQKPHLQQLVNQVLDERTESSFRF